MRRRHWIAALIAVPVVLAVWGYLNARADPVVRRATIEMRNWPGSAPPVTIAFASDVHAGNWVMDEARLARIVAGINAFHPDIVVLAGDFVAGHEPGDAAKAAPMLAPLARLQAPLGVFAVLGNHDHWTDAPVVARALAAAKVRLLANGTSFAGPVILGGIDDMITHHDRLGEVAPAMQRMPAAPVLVSHSPDIAPDMPAALPLLLAGHTHCGQLVLPLIGAINRDGLYRPRYRCGLVREGDRTVIVTAGLGTSVLPIRFGAPPDLWLVTVKGAGR